ncbi:MAG: acyltransferase [Planctomycetota bacterium]|nr:acyltransferase [Planctomycetota bacterium]
MDGLRAIAVLFVLWQHVPPHMPDYPEWLHYAGLIGPGGLGVHIFFVLSGFLITRILLVERERGLPLRRFMLRRLLRIFPIYYLLLLILWVSGSQGEGLFYCALYVANFWFIFGTNTAGAADVQHTWSLCIEEHVYRLWPLVVAFMSRQAACRILVFVVLPLSIASAPLGWLWTSDAQQFKVWTMYSSTVQFLPLGLGCLLAFGERQLVERPQRYVVIGGVLIFAGALCSSVVYALLPFLWFEVPPLIDEAYWPLMDVAYTTLIPFGVVMAAIAAQKSSVLAWLKFAPLRGVGRISYGLYLYHLPIFHGLIDRAAPTGGQVLLAVVTSFVAATVSYFVIERPLLRYGARFR